MDARQCQKGWGAFLGHGSLPDKHSKGILNKLVELIGIDRSHFTHDNPHFLLGRSSLDKAMLLEMLDVFPRGITGGVADRIELLGNLVDEVAGDETAARLVHRLRMGLANLAQMTKTTGKHPSHLANIKDVTVGR